MSRRADRRYFSPDRPEDAVTVRLPRAALALIVGALEECAQRYAEDASDAEDLDTAERLRLLELSMRLDKVREAIAGAQ